MDAWEVTVDDVFTVTVKHKLALTEDRLDQLFEDLDLIQIEQNVLSHTDFDDQVAEMLSTIEDQLMGMGIIDPDSEKLFMVE
jgi:hypothetical protein